MNYVKKSHRNPIKYNKLDNNNQQNNHKVFIAGSREASRVLLNQVIEQHVFDFLSQDSNEDQCPKISNVAAKKFKCADLTDDQPETTKIAKLDKLAEIIEVTSSKSKLKVNNRQPNINPNKNSENLWDKNRTTDKEFSNFKTFDEIQRTFDNLTEQNKKVSKNNFLKATKGENIYKYLKGFQNHKISKVNKTRKISQETSSEDHKNENRRFSDSFKYLNIEAAPSVVNLTSTNQEISKIAPHKSIKSKLKSIIKALKPSKTYQVKSSQDSTMRLKRISELPKYRRIRTQSVDDRIEEEVSTDLREILQESSLRLSKSTEHLDCMLDYGRIEAEDYELFEDSQEVKNGSFGCEAEASNDQAFVFENFNSSAGINQQPQPQKVNNIQDSTPKSSRVHDSQHKIPSSHNINSNLKNILRSSHTSRYVSKFARSIDIYSQNKSSEDDSCIDLPGFNKDASVKIESPRQAECSEAGQDKSFINAKKPEVKEHFKSLPQYKDAEPTISGRKSYKIGRTESKLDNKLRNIASYTKKTLDIERMNQNIEESLLDVEEDLVLFNDLTCDSEVCKEFSLEPNSLIQKTSNLSKDFPGLQINLDTFGGNPANSSQKLTNFEVKSREFSKFQESSANFLQKFPKIHQIPSKINKNIQKSAIPTNQPALPKNPSNQPKFPENSTISNLKREIEDLKLQIQLKDIKIDQLEKCEKLKDKQIEKITKIAEKKFSEVQKRENLLKIVKIQAEISNDVAKIKRELSIKSLEVEKFKEILTQKDKNILKIEKKLNFKKSELKSQQLKVEELQGTIKLRTNELSVMAKCWEESHEFACKLYEAKRNEWKQKLLDLRKVINNLELKIDNEEPKAPKTSKKSSINPNAVNDLTKNFIEKNFEAEMVPKLIKCLDNIDLTSKDSNNKTKGTKLPIEMENVSF